MRRTIASSRESLEWNYPKSIWVDSVSRETKKAAREENRRGAPTCGNFFVYSCAPPVS
jgi:hypothetical protein